MRRRIDPGTLSGVSEQSAAVGELPEDYEKQGRIVGQLPRRRLGESQWINRYTQVNNPFTTDGTSQKILAANPRRTYLLIQNKGVDFIYVNFNQNATVFNGIRIIAGGNYEIIGGESGGSHVPKDDIYILGAVAGLDGVATEGMLQGD